MIHRSGVLPEPDDVQVLLLYPRPADEELTSSWLIRLADANELPPSALTRGLGLPRLWAQDVDLALTTDGLASLARATRLPPERVVQTSLRPMLEQLNGQVNPVGRNPLLVMPEPSTRWQTGRGHPVCCECVNTTGQLFRGWRLATTLVCERHRRRLTDLCPHCGVPIHLARPRLNRRTSRTLHHPELNRCTSCGQQMDAGTRQDDEGLPGWQNAVVLQRLMLSAAVTGFAELGGIRLTVRELMCLIPPLLTLCDLRRPLARTLAGPDDPAVTQVMPVRGAVVPLEQLPVLQRWPILTRVGQLLRRGLSGCLELLRAAGAEPGQLLSRLVPEEAQGWFGSLVFESLSSFPGARRLTPVGLHRSPGPVSISTTRWTPLEPLLASEPPRVDAGSRSRTDRQALDAFLTRSLAGTAQENWQGTSSYATFYSRLNRWGATGQLDQVLERLILQFEHDLGGPLPGAPAATAALADDDV